MYLKQEGKAGICQSFFLAEVDLPDIYYQLDLKQLFSFCFHTHKVGLMASQGYCEREGMFHVYWERTVV